MNKKKETLLLKLYIYTRINCKTCTHILKKCYALCRSVQRY